MEQATGRRRFLQQMTGAAVGALAAGRGAVEAGVRALQTPAPGSRREVAIGGKRIEVIDVHAHCIFREVADVMTGTGLTIGAQNGGMNLVLGPDRIRAMDQQGVDIEALSINGFWYSADRDLADRVVRFQNQKLVDWCAAHPDRFVGLASVALQHPDLAAAQLEDAIKKLGLHGVAIGGSVGDGEEISGSRFDPFWAKAQELDAVVFMHPQPTPGTTQNARLQGPGGLNNVIGNPLETTVFLSHMILDGTLDRFPRLKICAAHAGGYLASYSGRSDAWCGRGGAACGEARKKPSDYFKSQIFPDSLIFQEDGLRHLVAACGVGQIVYGTDYPYGWPADVDFILNASMLSSADKEAVLGGTAARLLKLA